MCVYVHTHTHTPLHCNYCSLHLVRAWQKDACIMIIIIIIIDADILKPYYEVSASIHPPGGHRLLLRLTLCRRL